jgi:hypothetical protein
MANTSSDWKRPQHKVNAFPRSNRGPISRVGYRPRSTHMLIWETLRRGGACVSGPNTTALNSNGCGRCCVAPRIWSANTLQKIGI